MQTRCSKRTIYWMHACAHKKEDVSWHSPVQQEQVCVSSAICMHQALWLTKAKHMNKYIIVQSLQIELQLGDRRISPMYLFANRNKDTTLQLHLNIICNMFASGCGNVDMQITWHLSMQTNETYTSIYTAWHGRKPPNIWLIIRQQNDTTSSIRLLSSWVCALEVMHMTHQITRAKFRWACIQHSCNQNQETSLVKSACSLNTVSMSRVLITALGISILCFTL